MGFYLGHLEEPRRRRYWGSTGEGQNPRFLDHFEKPDLTLKSYEEII
jgi:hypothetical protein